MLDTELDNLFKAAIAQWNIAERRIKKAEQVQGNEVVNSAIFELRYAGRKIIDALQLILNANWQNDRDVYERICRYLADAIEDCVKAKHDSIDAMIDFVTTWFDELEGKIGLKKLLELFPEYLDVTTRIVAAQDKIAHSREHRLTSRDSVYDEIEANDYEVILGLYNKMRLSKDRVQAIVNSDNRRELLRTLALAVNIVLGAIIALGTIALVAFEIAKRI
jgi:hypothetical protein